MKFVTTIGNKELETLAWLLETKTKVHNVEFYKGIFLSLTVLAVTVYNIGFYDGSTTAQKCILIILSILCIAKTVLCKVGKIDYLAIAKRKNKKMRDKTITCIFEDAWVAVENGKQAERLEYADLKEWGMHKQCLYLLFGNGAAVVIDQSKYPAEDVEEVKQILYRSTNLNQS